MLLLRARLPSHHDRRARPAPGPRPPSPRVLARRRRLRGGSRPDAGIPGPRRGRNGAFIAAGRPLYDAADARHDTRRKPQIAAQNPRRPPGGGLALSKATQHSRAELKNERQLSTPPKRREKGKYQTVILEQALARKEIYETVSAPSTPSFWKKNRRRPWTTSPRSTSPAATRRGGP